MDVPVMSMIVTQMLRGRGDRTLGGVSLEETQQ